jgi:signal transduction histidine kinase
MKITVSVLLVLLISSFLVIISFLIFDSLLPVIIISFISLLFSLGIVYLIIKVVVLDKIYAIQVEVDKVSEADLKHRIEMKTKDEFHNLSRGMNELFKRIHTYHEMERTTLIEEVRASENEKYLENISDGLLFLDYGQIISGYYSRSLRNIFDREEIGGQHFSDFLYPDKLQFHEKRKELERFFLDLFHNPSKIDDVKQDNNPLHNVWISRDDGKRVLVDAKFRRVNESGQLVQILVIFKDRTDEGLLEKKLADKIKQSDFELESVLSLLKFGPGPFTQFVNDCELILQKFREKIKDLENRTVLEESLRDIHSMECSAGFFDFKAVEKLCLNLKDILSRFRDGDYSRKKALDIILDDLQIHMDHIIFLIKRIQSFLTTDEGRVYDTSKNEQEHFFDALRMMVERHAELLEKRIQLNISCDFETFPLLKELKNPIIHLLRNAVEHGIESQKDRIREEKGEKGRISLELAKPDEGTFRVVIEDDGRGIDFNHVRQLAVEKGFIKKEEEPGHENLIRTLFQSGFSIGDTHRENSCRGVGLDAVKSDIQSLGGKIAIKTEAHKGSRFTILIPSGLL